MTSLNATSQATPRLEKVGLPTSVGFRYFPINQIVCIQADGSYAKIFSTTGEVITTCRMLKDFERVLNPETFFRVHRAYIVNLRYIDALKKSDGGFLVMSNGKEVPMSRKDKEQIAARLHEAIRLV